MKALEMEDADEHESFLDSEDGALRDTPFRPSTKQTSFFATPNGKLASSFFLIAIIVLIFSGVAPEEEFEEVPSNPSALNPGNGVASAPVVTPTTNAIPSSTSDGDENSSNNEESTGLLYSNYATIVPDPYAPLPEKDAMDAIREQWGAWKFWDGEEDDRPTGDYCAAYNNRDIPGDEFPDTAWQADAVFVNHYLDAAEQLITRAKEAIFTEYGHGKPLPPEGLAERLKMFHWDKPDELINNPIGRDGNASQDQGGWTTKRSFKGLVRRLLHAMMTNDKFTVVLAGHSAAAGHGNHFHQSYVHQMHKIMEPVFARLGVQLVTRNMAQGGLGTLHHSLAFTDIYGDSIDLLLWDSGMTEGKEAFDLLLRQGLLTGQKIPMIWAAPGAHFETLRDLHNLADVDVGSWGTGMAGIVETTSVEQAKTLPKAVRDMRCATGAEDICRAAPRFCAFCWLRNDLDPTSLGFSGIRDSNHIGGQVRWHPGWQSHQLTGRVLAFALLEALQEAVQQWSDGTMGGPPLDDDFWHVTTYYGNIRNKVKVLDTGECFKGPWLSRICTTPMKGRGEHTPRVNPSESSLVSIIKAASDGYKPVVRGTVLYDGPEGHNSCYDVPEGDINALAIVSGRRRVMADEPKQQPSNLHARHLTSIDIGKGWEIAEEKPGVCDGGYYSICGRSADDDCPALGHHDSRGAIVGNEFAGWIVFVIPEVKHGLIMTRFLSYLSVDSNPRTKDWTSVNNEGRMLRYGTNATAIVAQYSNEDGERRLRTANDFPDEFKFEYSIGGQVTTLSKEEFLERRTQPQRVSELLTLFDDPSFSGTNVEVAIRLQDCGHDCMMAFTHLYWA